MANAQHRPRRTEVTRRSRADLLSYCADQVRVHHPERYLATLAAPAERRDALFALYAFDHEIGKVRHLVREPMAGLIRLQWWREVLAEIDAGAPPRAHPVVEALARALSAEAVALARLPAGLPARLDAAIEARERELEDPPPASIEALERHLEASAATITLAALDLLDGGPHTARQAGRWSGLGFGLVDSLRAIPLDARRRRLFLPADALDRHGVDPESVFRGDCEPELRGVVGELAAHARAYLDRAREGRRCVPRQSLPALLPGTLAGSYLRHLARAGHDPFAASPRRRSALIPLKLLWYRTAGRF